MSTCSQSLLFSPQVITGSEQDQIRCRKIRIYPSAKQLEVFNLCLRASRYIYNKANQTVIEMMSNARDARLSELEALKATDPRPTCCHFKKSARCMNEREDEWFCSVHKDDGKLGISYSAFMSLPKLRPLVMRSDVDIPYDSPEAWLKQVPYDTRQGAVKELVGAYKSAFALKRGGHIKSFNMRYKSKKAVKQVFHC
ncbi:hypothetical protein CEUSTIGMA_g14029.t1, partial [Chlamydomonas eustigma]